MCVCVCVCVLCVCVCVFCVCVCVLCVCVCVLCLCVCFTSACVARFPGGYELRRCLHTAAGPVYKLLIVVIAGRTDVLITTHSSRFIYMASDIR